MTLCIRYLLVLFLGLALSGCGYTVLQSDTKPVSQRVSKPDSPLSELSVSRIQRVERMEPSRTGEHLPQLVTDFRVTIRNAGSGAFDGAILCDYALCEEEIRHSRYPAHADPFAVVLRPGDTTTVCATAPYWFARGTNMRFRLRTDAYALCTFAPVFFFGREPIREASYENNRADFIIR
jgi:hypothetical protein